MRTEPPELAYHCGGAVNAVMQLGSKRVVMKTDLAPASGPPGSRALLDSKPLLVGLFVAWLGAIGGGLVMLWDYQNTPGAVAEPPAVWPAGSALRSLTIAG